MPQPPSPQVTRPPEDDKASTGDLWRFLTEVDDPGGFDWTVEGLFEAGDRLVLTGGEGKGKSTLFRQVAYQCAIGLHPFTHQPIEPQSVLYVDCENSTRQTRRAFHALAQIGGEEATRRAKLTPVSMGQAIELADPDVLDALCRRVEETAADIVVIGPLWKLTEAGDPDKEVWMKPVSVALDKLRSVRGSVLLIEAHAGHGVRQNGDGHPSGWSGWKRWPEFGIWLDDKGRLKRWRGDREERQWPERLMHGETWPWEPHRDRLALVGTTGADEARLLELAEAAAEIVGSAGEPLSQFRLLEALRDAGHGAKRQVMINALNVMADKGLVVETEGPRGARLFSPVPTCSRPIPHLAPEQVG